MSVRSRYKDKLLAEKSAEVPAASEKLNAEPAADAIASNPAVVLAEQKMAESDEATARLRQQLADLNRAQQLQQRAMLEQRVPNHTEKLAMWKAQGMSDVD